MNGAPRALLPVAAAAALLLAPLALRPQGAPASSRDRALAEIRREIASLESALGAVRERERSLATSLRAAELDLALQERRVAEAAAERAAAEEAERSTAARVEALAAELDATRASLAGRLSGLYRLGRDGPLRLALTVEPGADLPAAIRLLRFLVRSDAREVERYVATRARLDEERRELERERREVERWLVEAEARRDRLAAARSRQVRLLARAQAEREELARRTEALADKERKLSALIASLGSAEGGPLAGEPIERFRGVLDWPVAGEVTIGFGPRTDPRYRTQVPHNGLEIAPGPTAERDREGRARIAAVFPGKVLYAAPFEGYGRTVVLHHPGRVFTLYAGLDELLVETGRMVELGDPVGAAAGPVYFEVRKENRPEDPLGWLR